MSGARRAAVDPAAVRSRCEQFGEWLDFGDNGLCPSQHQCITVLQPPNAAGYARIDETESALAEPCGAAPRILVVGIAAVDQHIAIGDQVRQRLERLLGNLA